MPVIVPSVSKIIQRIVFNKLYTETLQHYVKSLTKKKKEKNSSVGESGYRSQYFPHAKRALFHLS